MGDDIKVIWDALQCYRENCISTDDEAWDEVCTAMAHVHEALGIEHEESD